MSSQLGGEKSMEAVQTTRFHVGQMNALPVTASQIVKYLDSPKMAGLERRSYNNPSSLIGQDNKS